MQVTGDGVPIRATVKWFNTAKGFGFVTPADGSPEAFLHLSALRQAGFDSIGEGAGLVVELGQSPKGRQVVRVIEVDPGAATPAREGGGGGGFRDRGDRGGFGGDRDRGGFGGPRGPRNYGGGGGFGGDRD
ncbi:MAG: cold shock domain-containing protein, partial [Alphaproteobacteria bacterium]|nr:cold shock domain-containing protein [Alphaproteobacteria bacterium]